MSSGQMVKSLVSAQRYRAIEKIRRFVSRKLQRSSDDFFLIHCVRLCQLCEFKAEDFSSREKWAQYRNFQMDAVIFAKKTSGKVSGPPVLCIHFTEDTSEASDLNRELNHLGLSYIISTEKSILDDADAQLSGITLERSNARRGRAGGPFNIGENEFLSVISAAVSNLSLLDPVLVTGQTSLGSITGFKGYSNAHRAPTDTDLLICTGYPVSIPLLAIEIDGPSHFQGNAFRKRKEKKKSEEKDAAFYEAQIPVLHIRVSKQTKHIVRKYHDLIARIISAALEHLFYSNSVYQKKLRYLDDLIKEFDKIADMVYSTAPQLEDYVRTAPQVIRWLRDSYLRSEHERLDLQAAKDADYDDQIAYLPPSQQDYPWREYQLLEAMPKASTEDLIALFDVQLKSVDLGEDDATMRVSGSVGIDPDLSGGLLLFEFSQSVPWMRFAGYQSDDFNDLMKLKIKHELAILGCTIDNQSLKRTSEKWLEKAICRKEKYSLHSELAETYRRSGIQPVISHIETLLRLRIRTALENRGYIERFANKKHNKTLAYLLPRWKWVRNKTSPPKGWNDSGERDPSLSLLLSIYWDLDDIGRATVSSAMRTTLASARKSLDELPLSAGDRDMIGSRFAKLDQCLKG